MMVKPCVVEGDGSTSSRHNGRSIGPWWYNDLGQHVNGEFSMAVIRTTDPLEDQSQLESGPLSFLDSGPRGTFVGVYDGHRGAETAWFVNRTLFNNLKKFASDSEEVTADVIRKAYLATDEEFLSLVMQQWSTNPQIAATGTCCLVGVICNGLLYVANAGDSRAVLGRADKSGRGVTAVQLSTEHSAELESVRDELRSLHPHIEIIRQPVCRLSRSIGDAYLKRSEFYREPFFPEFMLKEPFTKPILSAEPSILVHELKPEDHFLIFASDGLWENLSNQEAVDIVHNNPRNGIARRLVRIALQRAAKKREMRYKDLQGIKDALRRYFHNDITVVIIYIDIDCRPLSLNQLPHPSSQ